MNSTDVPPTRVRTAIALSIAAHVCALALLALLLSDRPTIVSSALDNGPALIMTTIERRTSPPPRRPVSSAMVSIVPRPAPGAARRATPVARAAAPYPTVKTPAAPVHEPSRGHGRHPRTSRGAPGPARVWLTLATPLPTATPPPLPTTAPATSAPTPTTAPATSAPTPTTAPATSAPTPAPTPTRSAALAVNFGGLFSQNYPPALAAPSELAAIRSRLSGPVRIRVDVDETGHATEVRFVGPVSNPGVEQDIRSTLLALHYVPADCNGLHCEGTLEIAY